MRILISLLIVFIGYGAYSQEVGDSTKTASDSLHNLSQQVVSDSTRSHVVVADTVIQQKDTLSIIGVGDIMMGTNYPVNRLPPGNGAFLLKGVDSVLMNADITFGNLEGVLLDQGGTPKRCSNPKVCYAFRSPVSYVKNFLRAGFDVMSLANNHAGDFGQEGRESSMQVLDSAGIVHAGQITKPYATFIRDSIRYGFMALAPNSGCLQLNNMDEAVAIVQHLDSISDVVIVSFHGGAEGSDHQHVTRKTEIFYGENRGNVYLLSRKLIDAGADIIFGHGPHVTRAIDLYKGRFIAYSLGNFCTYEGISINGVNGLAPIIKLQTNRNGEFLKGEIIPTFQTRANGVQIDPNKRVIGLIRELTEKDLPESKIRIDDNGIITYLAQ